MEKYQRWALKSSSFIYFASASPQPLNRIYIWMKNKSSKRIINALVLVLYKN